MKLHHPRGHPYSSRKNALEHKVEHDRRHWGRWTTISVVLFLIFMGALLSSTYMVLDQLSDRSEMVATGRVVQLSKEAPAQNPADNNSVPGPP